MSSKVSLSSDDGSLSSVVEVGGQSGHVVFSTRLESHGTSSSQNAQNVSDCADSSQVGEVTEESDESSRKKRRRNPAALPLVKLSKFEKEERFAECFPREVLKNHPTKSLLRCFSKHNPNVLKLMSVDEIEMVYKLWRKNEAQQRKDLRAQKRQGFVSPSKPDMDSTSISKQTSVYNVNNNINARLLARYSHQRQENVTTYGNFENHREDYNAATKSMMKSSFGSGTYTNSEMSLQNSNFILNSNRSTPFVPRGYNGVRKPISATASSTLSLVEAADASKNVSKFASLTSLQVL